MTVKQKLNILVNPKLQTKKRSLYYIAWKTEEGYESCANTHKYEIKNGKLIFKEPYKNSKERVFDLDNLVKLEIKKIR